MPTFEITAPDGAKYRVTGPEGSTEQDALARVRSQMGGSPAPSGPQATEPSARITVGPQQPRSMLDTALQPITEYGPTYNTMRRDAQDQMGRGVDQIASGGGIGEVAKGAGNVALGGIGYVASPINAALRSFVGRPIEQNTGIPAEYTDFAAGLAIPGFGMARISGAPVRTMRQLSPGERVTQAGENLAGVGTGGAVTVPKAVASDNILTQRAGATVSNVPFAGTPLVKSADDTINSLGRKTQDIVQEYGSGSTVTAGDAARKSVGDWASKDSAEAIKKVYERVDNLVNPNVTTDLTNTRLVSGEITARRMNAAIDKPSEAVARIKTAITTPGGLNYEGIKDLRTYVGELLEKPHLLPADLRESELKRIYGGLSKDLRSSVSNAGGAPALAAFERANKYHELISGRREALAKIVGNDPNAPAESVFNNIVTLASTGSRADIARLAQARKAMGKDSWNEVAAAAISRMGRPEDMGARITNTGTVNFSPQKFLTEYREKLSPAGRALLFRSAGKESIAPYLDDIATVSERFKELQKFANPSGTGQITSGVGALTALWAEPVSAITALVGTNMVARVLASPATVAPVAQWSKKYQIAVQKPSPANAAMLVIASRNLVNTLNAKLGLTLSPEQLLKAMQPIQGRAEDEQPSVPRIPGQ
jgi:hypothetical protein